MPNPDDYDYSGVAEACRTQQEYCVIAGDAGFGDIINGTGMLRSMEQTLVDLITDDPAGLLLADRRMRHPAGDHRAHPRGGARAASTSSGWARTWAPRSRPIISLDRLPQAHPPRSQTFIDLAKPATASR